MEQIFNPNPEIELQETIYDLQQQNSLLAKECQEQKLTISSFNAVKMSFEQQMQTVTKKYANQIQELMNSLETEKQSVARKVNMTLATIGVDMFAPEEISPAQQSSPESIYKQYTSMPEGKDKEAFYTKHQKMISDFMGLR